MRTDTGDSYECLQEPPMAQDPEHVEYGYGCFSYSVAC